MHNKAEAVSALLAWQMFYIVYYKYSNKTVQNKKMHTMHKLIREKNNIIWKQLRAAYYWVELVL